MMQSKEQDLQREVYNRFKVALAGTKYSISQNDVLGIGANEFNVDILIKKNSQPFAVVNSRPNIHPGSVFVHIEKLKFYAYSISTRVRFGILASEDTFYIWDAYGKENLYERTFDEIIAILRNPDQAAPSATEKKKVVAIFKEAVGTHFASTSPFYKYVYDKGFAAHINFDEKTHTFIFEEEANENRFFNRMFGEFGDKQICRYTSLHAVFTMLNNLSFRMCGIAGMNDKSEINYADEYLANSFSGIFMNKPIEKEHHTRIIALNKRFITSCSTLEHQDDLAMWRLYSDDGKGVSLIFDVNYQSANPRVLIQKVKYADKDGNHRELELLKHIISETERHTRFKFQFRLFNYWKHFFKPYDYHIEEEVRMLIVNDGTFETTKADWVMTYGHNVVNPVIDFRLNSSKFPLQLRKIILGPKCPEQMTNLVQLQEMIRHKRREVKNGGLDCNIEKLKVETSKITHYR